jgi:hypothetical protein
MAKIGLDVQVDISLPLYANLFLPEKFLFSERAGLLIIHTEENYPILQ